MTVVVRAPTVAGRLPCRHEGSFNRFYPGGVTDAPDHGLVLPRLRPDLGETQAARPHRVKVHRAHGEEVVRHHEG